jgi:hypothetical protein
MALTIVAIMAITVLALGIGIALATRASVHQRRAARPNGYGGSGSHVWMSADSTVDCDASGGSTGADCGGGDGGGGGSD